jgi:glycosyltransferase involved in cell wall biosynthesis
MRVAFNGYFWDQPRTGSGQYLRHLWDALPGVIPPSQKPSSQLLMLLPPGIRGDDLVPVDDLRRARRVAPNPLEGKSANLDKLAWESLGVARAARRAGAQLLHVPYLAAPWRKGLSVVVTAHDMIPWVVPGYSGSLAVRLYLELAARATRRARLILADSEASRLDVIRILKVSPSRVHTVYLGTEPHPNYTEAQLDEVRARHGLPRDFAFYIGGFDTRKNVPLLLRAWRDFVEGLGGEWCAANRPVLAIGGAVPQAGGVFPDVLNEADRLGLRYTEGGTVRFLGRISEEDKPVLMAAARLFVYPSAYEGFGLDPLEAMSVGCPVVSSSGGSLKEVVGDAGLLVPPGDEPALAKAIRRAWADGSLRESLGAQGKERAALFTWQRTAEQTWRLYGLALHKRRPRRGPSSR